MKRAFTLVEVLIVVAVLGILAAIVIPQFQAHSQEAKEAAAKDNLRIMRNAIERYAVQHNDVPPGTRPGEIPELKEAQFYLDLIRGSYISEMPENPFNNLTNINVIIGDQPLPEAPTGNYGWIYKLTTKDFRIDWPGTDSKSVSFYDY